MTMRIIKIQRFKVRLEKILYRENKYTRMCSAKLCEIL